MNPQNATQIALNLASLARQLDEAREQLDKWDEEAVHARAVFEVAEAQAYIGAKGSVDERKRQARLATQEEWLTTELADMKVRKGKRAMTVLERRIAVGQSYGAAVRAEVGLAGYAA
jgi:hypothetical protein